MTQRAPRLVTHFQGTLDLPPAFSPRSCGLYTNGGVVAGAHHGGMTITSNKQIVEEFITALFTNGDLTAVDRYLDPDFINHDRPLPDSPYGPEGMRQAGEVFRHAFPDWRSDMQQMIAEDDLVTSTLLPAAPTAPQ
jgi:hypothetical protein